MLEFCIVVVDVTDVENDEFVFCCCVDVRLLSTLGVVMLLFVAIVVDGTFVDVVTIDVTFVVVDTVVDVWDGDTNVVVVIDDASNGETVVDVDVDASDGDTVVDARDCNSVVVDVVVSNGLRVVDDTFKSLMVEESFIARTVFRV